MQPEVVDPVLPPAFLVDLTPEVNITIIDNKPKTLSAEQTEALKGLARQVIQLFELRKKNDLLIKSEKQNNTTHSHY